MNVVRVQFAPGDESAIRGDAAMRRLALGKGLRYALVLLAIVTLNFVLPRLLPGDPVLNLMGEHYSYSQEAFAEIRHSLGLDRPWPEQYLRYLRDMATGQFGYSFTFKRPVVDVLGAHLPWTALLLAPSVVFGALAGLLFGTLAGWRRGGRLDAVVTGAALLGYAFPQFWLAMLAITVFAFRLGLVPLAGATSGEGPSLAGALSVLRHLALPLLVVTLSKAAYDAVLVRNSVVATLAEDHVIAALARGVPVAVVALRHVVYNSLAPLVTVTALQFGNLFAGALLVEVVFSWPGMGLVIYEAVAGRDYPLVQASFLLIAVCVLAANYLADLAYAWLDPRIRANG